MKFLARAAPWLARAALTAAGLILLLIAAKFIGEPIRAAAASDIRLGSALAVTNMRASFGAFPLGCAIYALASLTSRRFHLSGLLAVAAVLGSALAVRSYGIVADGTFKESMTVLTAEAIILGLCLIAIIAELESRSLWPAGRQPN